jgi:signal transduction histidine kinase
MLSFARPSHGESTLVDVVEVLESSIRLAEKDYNQQRQFDFRNIQVEKNFAENLPKIKAQKNQLSQVLLNLLVNAAQALATQKDNPKPTIWVSAAVGNYNLRIDIKDNGPGMNEQTRKRVFEPFFTTKNEGKGTGLGLSVSYFIISEQLGGNLRVESEVGHGTCFTIQIPIKRQAQKSPKQDPGDEQIQLPFDGV